MRRLLSGSLCVTLLILGVPAVAGSAAAESTTAFVAEPKVDVIVTLVTDGPGGCRSRRSAGAAPGGARPAPAVG